MLTIPIYNKYNDTTYNVYFDILWMSPRAALEPYNSSSSSSSSQNDLNPKAKQRFYLHIYSDLVDEYGDPMPRFTTDDLPTVS